jgi:hypothetical protein
MEDLANTLVGPAALAALALALAIAVLAHDWRDEFRDSHAASPQSRR